jgi:hypothetical protein
MVRYISFSPYYSGLVNIIMSYEMFLAIAAITKRKVILPPDCWMLFLSKSQKKEDWIDFWKIFDKEVLLEEFDCIEHRDVPEFQGKLGKMQGKDSYTRDIGRCDLDLSEIIFDSSTVSDEHTVFVNEEIDTQDFHDFCHNRTVMELDCDEQFLHFENNLFGHYWYHVYPGGENLRNKLKDKVNRVLRYNDKFYFYADTVHQELGPFNSIHVRRNDFLDAREDEIQCVNAPEKILEMVDRLPFYDKSLPLYIATDEQDRSFFDLLGEKYDIHFYEDFDYKFGDDFEEDDLHIAVLEQTICSQSENFFGTYLSTFSKRINIMRGLENRQAEDHLGINHLPEEPDENLVDVFPWRKMSDNTWQWNSSSHLQWMHEENGKLVEL